MKRIYFITSEGDHLAIQAKTVQEAWQKLETLTNNYKPIIVKAYDVDTKEIIFSLQP